MISGTPVTVTKLSREMDEQEIRIQQKKMRQTFSAGRKFYIYYISNKFKVPFGQIRSA
jgi:hypothetical protein